MQPTFNIADNIRKQLKVIPNNHNMIGNLSELSEEEEETSMIKHFKEYKRDIKKIKKVILMHF